MEAAKSTRWQFTAYEQQWSLFEAMPPIIVEWGWQQEVCPKTQRPHYQGYVRTGRQVRFSQLKKALPGVHLEPAKNWDALVNYCKKEETAVAGTQVHETTTFTSLSMAKALIKVAQNRPLNVDFSRCETTKDVKDKYAYEYEVAVGVILEEDENLVGVYSQPQYERAYVKWRSVWVRKAESEKTDRQTDKEEDSGVRQDEELEEVRLED